MPLLLLLWPVLEIMVYARVCMAIGTGDALLLSLLSIIAGSWLIQRQGFGSLMAQQAMNRQAFARNFAGSQGALFDRLCLALAGLLLILPGFLSDIAALVLMVPAGRKWVQGRIGRQGFATSAFHARKQNHSPHSAQPSGPGAGDVIEGDYERIDGNDPD